MSRPLPDQPGRVLVVGSVNLDHVVRAARLPAPGETLAASGLADYAGGKGGNQAAAAARAGARVSLVSVVGADPAGEALLRALDEQGVDTAGVRRSASAATGATVITVTDSGENTILVVAGANGDLDTEEVGRSLTALSPGTVVLTQLETPLPVVRALATWAREPDLPSGGAPAPSTPSRRLVINASPLPDDDATVRRLWDDVMSAADPLVVNELEAGRLLAAVVGRTAGPVVSTDEGPGRQATVLVRAGARSVVVTAGARGAWWDGPERDGGNRPGAPGRAGPAGSTGGTGGTAQHVPAFPAGPVVDTTGAGDAFVGALAAQLAARSPMARALVVAARAGAEAVAWRGAQPVVLRL